jgi:hypothetical protein
MRPSIPDFITLFDDDDRPFKVRFDYDAGEEQWFDARAGVGSPGYPPGVEVYEVDFGHGWEPLETYPQLNIGALEQAVTDHIIEIESAAAAEQAEAEYQAWQGAKKYEGWDKP